MQVIATVTESIWDMLNEMSPYLLLGFLIAGLMHAFIPGRVFSKYLSGNSFRSVLYSALFGIPLPLCSCGVIPTAMSLRKEGASRGATVSFLIATPQTGVDSILATYSLLGLPFAILRPIAALVTALFGGCLTNVTTSGEEKETVAAKCEKDGSCSSTTVEGSFLHRCVVALKYGYVEMMSDIGRWLVIGIVLAGVISLIPNEFFAIFKDNSLLSILLVLCLSIPMYLCATGSIPIAVALMLKGLTPGAALVLLMAGPASNMASIMVIGKVMGRRTLATYLASIVSGAVAFALIIDYLLPCEWFTGMNMPMGDCCHKQASPFAIGCSIILILLLVNALVRRFISKKAEAPTEANTMTIHVDGMHCSHCAAGVKKALESVDGIEEANVDLASGRVDINGSAPIDELRKEVEAIGFSIRE